MENLTAVKPLVGYRIEVTFADGVSGIVDVSNRLFGPMFEPLKDVELFRRVSVDEFGAPVWPNGADLAPDALYEDLTSRKPDKRSG